MQFVRVTPGLRWRVAPLPGSPPLVAHELASLLECFPAGITIPAEVAQLVELIRCESTAADGVDHPPVAVLSALPALTGHAAAPAVVAMRAIAAAARDKLTVTRVGYLASVSVTSTFEHPPVAVRLTGTVWLAGDGRTAVDEPWAATTEMRGRGQPTARVRWRVPLAGLVAAAPELPWRVLAASPPATGVIVSARAFDPGPDEAQLRRVEGRLPKDVVRVAVRGAAWTVERRPDAPPGVARVVGVLSGLSAPFVVPASVADLVRFRACNLRRTAEVPADPGYVVAPLSALPYLRGTGGGAEELRAIGEALRAAPSAAAVSVSDDGVRVTVEFAKRALRGVAVEASGDVRAALDGAVTGALDVSTTIVAGGGTRVVKWRVPGAELDGALAWWLVAAAAAREEDEPHAG